jgi:hypothetical protein
VGGAGRSQRRGDGGADRLGLTAAAWQKRLFELSRHAVFASITVVCYARIVPTLLAQGDRLKLAVAVVQVTVLLAAALL